MIIIVVQQYGMVVKSWGFESDYGIWTQLCLLHCDLLQVAKFWENNLFLSVLVNWDKNSLYLIKLFCRLDDIIHIKCWVLNSRTLMTIITRLCIND